MLCLIDVECHASLGCMSCMDSPQILPSSYSWPEASPPATVAPAGQGGAAATLTDLGRAV